MAAINFDLGDFDLAVNRDSLFSQLGFIQSNFFRHYIMFRTFFMKVLVVQSLDANIFMRYQIIISNIFNSIDFAGALENNVDIIEGLRGAFVDYSWFSTSFAAFDFDLYLKNVGFTAFSDFSTCDLTCGAGSQSRTRTCRLFPGQTGVFGCSGNDQKDFD